MKQTLALQAGSKFLLGIILISLLLFLPAGTPHYPNAWLFLAALFLPMLFAGIVPHGLIEFPALFLALAMSLYTCDQLGRRWRRDEEAHSLRGCAVLSLRLYSLVLVPLLAVAAWIESAITPLFISLFS